MATGVIIAVFRFIIWAMLAFWITVTPVISPNQILAAPMNHDDALALRIADERTQQLSNAATRVLPFPALLCNQLCAAMPAVVSPARKLGASWLTAACFAKRTLCSLSFFGCL